MLQRWAATPARSGNFGTWTRSGALAMSLLFTLIALLVLVYGLLCAFYYLFQERFIFVRFRLSKRFRFRFKHRFLECELKGHDGAALHGLYFPAEQPKGVILYFHGNTGSLRRWGKYAPRYTRLGYDVLMPDHRGYGKSRGALSEAALHADALQWYDYLAECWEEQDIVVYGRSLGSGLATPVAAARKPRLLILETPFANLLDVARYYLPILPYRLLLRYRFRNDLAVRRVKCPVYIFHGKRDTIVPYTSALKLYSLIPADITREMFTFPKGHHSDLVRFVRFNRALARILAAPPALRSDAAPPADSPLPSSPSITEHDRTHPDSSLGRSGPERLHQGPERPGDPEERG